MALLAAMHRLGIVIAVLYIVLSENEVMPVERVQTVPCFACDDGYVFLFSIKWRFFNKVPTTLENMSKPGYIE